MYEVIVQELAQQTLDWLEEYVPRMFERLIIALRDLGERGTRSSSTYKLSNAGAIFRKRVGRYRILFTFDGHQINVWIIDIEKDTKKDYLRWIRYIQGHFSS